ncbi:MAG: CpsD/CapB family tyrosine-protein kinase [Clostridiales bacterium]|nr:CpsD/CapB family tyrosine-protein kinase [Clostridiales bacterium]
MKRIKIENFPELDYATKEAMNTLCTNIVFAGDSVRRILVTSCREHEGKTFISMGIMHTLASMGYAVVLIDGDLRRSVLASKYGIHLPANTQGLAHYLSREISLDDVVCATDVPGAYVIPVGHDVVNSMQLLNNWRFEELLDQLSSKVDYVIVDTPPVGAIVDAAVVAKSCDGAILVVSSNLVTKQEVANAKKQIEKSGCPMIGAVLNKVQMDRSSSRYYHRSMYAAYESKNYYRRSSDSEETKTKEKGKKRGVKAK